MLIRLLTRCGCERVIKQTPVAPTVRVLILPDRAMTLEEGLLAPFEVASRQFRRAPHMDQGGVPTYFEEMSR